MSETPAPYTTRNQEPDTLNPELATLLEAFESIHEKASRLTSGNCAHTAQSIKAIAYYMIELINETKKT
ncbi:MAG: hypothetical protein KGZ82_10700 [Bacteroidales bacterium]|nr:hypothetical protein [Bacteroidales bacterium]